MTLAGAATTPIRAPRLRRAWRARGRMTAGDRRLALAFAAPAIILVGVLMYYPMIGTFFESLYSVSFINPHPRFVGFANYARILADPVFAEIVRNSLIWTIGVVALQNGFGFAVALLLNHNLPGQGLMRSLVLLPWVLPGVVAAILWRFMYDPQLGLLNSFLISLGLTQTGIAWLANTATALPAAILAAVWKGFPFSTVVYLAGLQSVDREQIEAATIDGAGPWRRLTAVVLPSMRAVIATNLLITTILTFNYFDMIWVLTRGGPEDATHIFPTRIYELGFGQFRFGEAAVYGVFSILVLAGFVAAFLVVQRRQGETG
ncbi:MAG TPA: sugar ABC transporter permease [Acetobacteraceae bacterium]|nr:sugar ABC transporter permease [Acetobacteraceae bacterium]